ncbi:MAG: hypothetical protein UR90_C0013G0006 [Parcubacteria group bacterium GW2011_GWC1_35_8]|uniref:Zinc-binding domain-containing protein n=3 Tax=Candidatus Nomuraibacteriota TaxID=1752729 RepID=A0A0G0DLB2_9BACT|nr:MAG: hypothetical protein UR90_C0013G0006 [Parcubacteria group bacterium GW2011_GWC1_35_8]KKP89581.1 MAG: hypothetical protein UR91_C0002G0009 [Candidatus Nomurabacteria bacterium GW2011_GWC2_35_8]
MDGSKRCPFEKKIMKVETKNCQNCKKEFTIFPDDFKFYEKIQVPPPTWCPECRMVRRMLFRNERSLYKQDCGLCKKSVISMYDPEQKYLVYCIDCYNSDNWDPFKFGKKIDFFRSFFEQLGELLKSIPRRALYQDFAENSEYTNQIVYIKNSYLCFGGHHYEDSNYSAQNFYLKSSSDVDFSHNNELCYESLRVINCYKVKYGYFSENCMDSWFIYACRNCSSCVGCTNLVGKTHCIFNIQYSKDEYERRVKEMNLSDRESLEKMKKEFWQHSLNFPRKYANIKNIINSTGDNLENVKDCHHAFLVPDGENMNYVFFCAGTNSKDCFDIDHVGLGSTECCEVHSGFGDNRVKFSTRVYYSHNVEYSDDCYNSEYLFACAGLRKKQYCILNTQYSKEEYDEFVLKIKKSMEEMPFIDKKGRIYKYGEFFPFEIIPFAYNDSVVSEYFPLTKEEILRKGYKYKEPEVKNYKPTITFDKLPVIKNADDNILKEIIQCEHNGDCNHKCTTAFRIIQNELNISKILEVPLPKLCPNCRHMERIEILNPPKLYHRKCMNQGCKNEFETSYAPDRPEIIYCDSCYKKEVY